MNDTQEDPAPLINMTNNNTSLGIEPVYPTSTTLMTYRLFIWKYGFIIICISIFIIVITSAFVYTICVFSKKEGSKRSNQGSGLSSVSAAGSNNAFSVKSKKKKKKKNKHKKKLKPLKSSNDGSSDSSVAQDSVIFKTKTISQLQKLGKKKKKALIPIVSSADSDSDEDGNNTNQLKVKQKLVPKVSKLGSSKNAIKQLKNVKLGYKTVVQNI